MARHKELDLGESEAIALVLELPGLEVVVLDDAKARRVAAGMGPTVTGTVGMLVAAKAHGLTPSLRHALDDLRAVGFNVGDAIYARALQRAGK